MVFHNMVGWRDRSNRIEIERDALRAENARLLAVNARLREALKHAEAAMEGMASDQLTAVETANLWNATMESIRATLEVKP
jgi:hypothetical protein